MQKGISEVFAIIAVIFIFAIVAGGIDCYSEYQKVSKTMINAEILAGQQKYSEALAQLESLQNNWLVKYSGLKIEAEIINKINENRQLLADKTNYDAGVEKIKEADWNRAKDLLMAVSDKSPLYQDTENKVGILSQILDCQYRKGEYEMKVTDPQGMVTGLVDGEVKQEIPRSLYASGTVIVFSPSDNYIYDFHAIKGGNYEFTLVGSVRGKIVQYDIENIPIPTGANHRVEVDSDATSGEEGLLSIDNDGNGIFEKQINFGEKLTCEEYIARTEMPDIKIAFKETQPTSTQATTTAPASGWAKTYSYPYAASWQDNFIGYSIYYDLTKITMGEKTIDNFTSYSSTFRAGEKINALILYFKINKVGQTGSGVCPIVNMRMELNEEGDLGAPVNNSFNADCFWDNQTYYDQQVIFSVPETQRKFSILTENQSGLVLKITLLNNGDIKLEKSSNIE